MKLKKFFKIMAGQMQSAPKFVWVAMHILSTIMALVLGAYSGWDSSQNESNIGVAFSTAFLAYASFIAFLLLIAFLISYLVFIIFGEESLTGTFQK